MHLEIMLVGCGSLWLNVGPERQQKILDLDFPFYSVFVSLWGSVSNIKCMCQKDILHELTLPCQIAPSTSSLFLLFYRKTGSPASLVGGSGRIRKTTEGEEQVSEQ